ncbi:hypothetical protein [Corynebacterium sp. p3-SID1194]|uniref:hypothetical protein n=1 Tax=Corynebacterium sp. p3-SID1194 TaxID=2916105 RepID=UPI0021A2D6AE|nr:hypothetical protein [Corynebacterium sp. p3-SID1194]MCT1450644.1 hypothetical protein [Corynebacterium sp. p3-SID1194]
MTEPGIIFNQSLEVAGPRYVSSPYSSEPVADWSQPQWAPVDFLVSVQPDSSSEDGVERPTTVSRFILITPPGTDLPALAADSQVRVGGVMVCDVVGEPGRWPDPFNPGVVHHVEAVLEVVRG